jgi:hypothetical protein
MILAIKQIELKKSDSILFLRLQFLRFETCNPQHFLHFKTMNLVF